MQVNNKNIKELKECPYCWRKFDSSLKKCPYCGKKIVNNIKEQKTFFNKLFRR